MANKATIIELVLNGDAAQKIAAQVESFTAETLGAAYTIEADSIRYASGLARRSELGELDALKKAGREDLIGPGPDCLIHGAPRREKPRTEKPKTAEK